MQTPILDQHKSGILQNIIATILTMVIGAVAIILWNMNIQLASVSAQMQGIDRRLQRIENLTDSQRPQWNRKESEHAIVSIS